MTENKEGTQEAVSELDLIAENMSNENGLREGDKDVSNS